MTFKIKISWFYDYSESIMEMKQNQAFFDETYSYLMAFFIGQKILKYFNDFYN